MAATPPITAMYWPMYFFTEFEYMSYASMARSSPFSEASRTLRRSLLMPEMPSRPDCLFIRSFMPAASSPSLSMMYGTMAGSMAPQRVPIMRPSSGVRPMDVSTATPWSMALMEHPLPRWHVMSFNSSSGSPKTAAARSEI